jgi:hypothetical protein
MTVKGGCFYFPEKGETVMKETGYYRNYENIFLFRCYVNVARQPYIFTIGSCY